MKKFFTDAAYKFQRFMTGRYGIDQLWRALLVFYFAAIIIANILYRFSRIAYWAFFVLSIAILIFAVFRVFSKNIEARRAENASWLKLTYAIKQQFAFQKNKFSQRKTHKFVKCKTCKKVLRLPRHKGKINVTCPHCHNSFIINTGKKQ